MSIKAVITGGASGIGYATAKKLLADGGTVCLLDMNEKALADAQTSLGGDRVMTATADVRDAAALDIAIRAGAEFMGGLNACVASAGIGYRVPILESETSDFERVLSINLTGVYSTLRAAALVMVEQGSGGSIVTLASVCGVRGCADRAAYGAAKAGVINLSETAAIELAQHKIRVNALCPSPINTPLIEGLQDAQAVADWMVGIPMGRYGEPEEVAELASFLLSDKASYITGQSIGVDGGWMGAGLQNSAYRGSRPMTGIKDIRIGAFRVRTVTVPLPQPHKTASGTLHAAPLVLLDIETDAGVTGSSYLFPYAAFFLRPLALLVSELEELVKGQPLMPRDIWTMLKTRTRLAGYPGLMACATGGIDMALWDALAKAHGLPLASLLGAAPRPVWVYDSLGQMGPEETARDIERSLKDGFRAFKVKSGAPDPRVDVAVARAIKSVAGDDAWTAMDFNQAFSAEEAVKRMHLLDHEGIAWIEEPVAWDDFEGHANVRAAISTPVQSGENWYGARDMAKMIEAGAIDHAMPDAMRIGGVTGWMEVAGLAAAHNIPVSSHLFPDHSVHLLAATPTGHILEWFDLAAGILAERPKIKDGMVSPLDMPGAGIVWDEKAIDSYAV